MTVGVIAQEEIKRILNSEIEMIARGARGAYNRKGIIIIIVDVITRNELIIIILRV